MTRIVVMDRELHEPLTILEVPASYIRDGLRHIRFTLPVDISSWLSEDADASMVAFRTTSITLESVFRFHERGRDERLFWYAYADDPETVLLLRCAFLPGQVSEVRRREAEAYLQGAFGQITGFR